MSASDLAERYGRTARDKRRTRVWAVGLAGAIAIVCAAWAIWVGLFQPTASIESNDVGNSRISDRAIKVVWELSMNPGATAKCAVQALNKDFGVVGWKIVDIPASDRRSRTLSTGVLTSEPAVSGLIYRCWLT